MKIDKDNLPIFIVGAVLICIVIVTASIIGIGTWQSEHRANAWVDFADQMNRNADYYLEKNTGGTCGYIKKAMDSEGHYTTITVSCSSSETTYTRVYAKEGGLALEWHKITPSLGDRVTSTTYIPYESICYVQANKVVV